MLITLSAAGCAQERLTVADACDEYNAIINVPGRSADEAESLLKDLEERVPRSMQEPWANVTDYFERGGNGVAEWTETDRQADLFFKGQCPQEDS